MKKKLSKSIISIVLAIAVLVTSIPLMSWTAIAQTVAPAVTSAQDDSLAETSADVSAVDTGDSNITVDYPTTADNKKYTLDMSGFTTEKRKEYDEYTGNGLFDAVTYCMMYNDMRNTFCTVNGDTITIKVASLFNHFLDNGKKEGRIASPFFCIRCYVGENEEGLYPYYDAKNGFTAAWHHLMMDKGGLTQGARYVSPIFNPADYKEMYSGEFSTANLGRCLSHFTHYNDIDLRQPREDFNYIGYFYNNNSIYHKSGMMECYRKRLMEVSDTIDAPSGVVQGGCAFHDRVGGTPGESPKTEYSGYADINGGLKSDGTTNPNFTATITSIVNFKNIALNDEGNAVAAKPSDSSNQKWYFEKQKDGTYTIRLAETSNNALTYENTDNTKKYLIIDDQKNLVVSETPSETPSETQMKWRIYKNDGAYVLQPITTSRGHVLNMADNGKLSITRYNNTVLKTDKTDSDSYTIATAQNALHTYQNFTMNQQFILNTTNSTTADSDELPAHFFTNLGMFRTESSTTIDTSVGLTFGDRHPRTRATDVGHYGADQEWCFDRQADGTYLISNTGNGLYLCYDSSVEKVNPTSPGVGSYEYFSALTKENDGSDVFKWILRKRVDGGYFIIPVASAARDRFWEGTFLQQAVDGNPGKEYLLYGDRFFEGSKVKYSVFDIQPKEVDMPYAHIFGNTKDERESFYATISSAKSEYKDFYIQNSTQEETAIDFKDTGNQKKHTFYWQFKRRADGTYIIYSTTTVGYCLTAKKDTLYLAKDSFATAMDQLWYVFEYDGKFKIQHKRTGKVLQIDASGNPTFEFDNMNYSNDVQLFNIKETDMTINTVNENFKVNLFNYGTRINNTDDDKFVLDFVDALSSARDKRNMSIGAGDGVIPEMSRVLDEEGYPYVEKYAFSYRKANSKVKNSVDYGDRVIDEIYLTPNYGTSGSLQYLFDVSSGFVIGGNDSPIDKYDTSVEHGDEYRSQAFKVTNPTGLFQKDSDGYYYYDSSKNSAYLDFDADNPIDDEGTLSGTIKLYDYLTHPHGVIPMDDVNYKGMFLPFNLAHEQGKVWYERDYYTEVGFGDFHYNYKDWNNPELDKASYTIPLFDKNITDTEKVAELRKKVADMWFGMTLETDFYHIEKLNNQPVKFEFSGDDDVWVYIDGVLVLDIGDTHGRIGGSINFDDSTVTAPVKVQYQNTNDGNKKVQYSDGNFANAWKKNSDNSYASEKKSIYSMYYNALEEVKDDAERAAKIEATIRRSFEGLADAEIPEPNKTDIYADPKLVQLEQHNLKFFYLERGSGASNCSIKLNTFSGGTTVSKEVTNLNEELAEVLDYKFKAVTVDENGNETPLANSPYTVSSTMSTFSNDGVATASELKTDENGCFTIKANQNAHLSKVVPGSTIKVYEIIDDVAAKTSWRTQVAGEDNRSGDGVETDPVIVPSDSTLEIIFKNDYEPSQDVIITKSLDKSNLGDNYRPNVNQTYDIGFEILDLNGNLVTRSKLSLHDDEIGTISDIPVGYTYRIWEYYPANTKLNFEAPVFQKKGKEPETKMFVASGAAAPGTESYMQGKSVLGVNDEYTITNKLVDRNTISVTFKYYNRKRVDGAPAQINSYSTSYKKNLKAEEWDKYVDTETQRINFSKLIADQGILFNGTVGVDNIIDEYQVWTSQAEAEAGFAEQTNYFADKENGKYQKYGETNPNDLAYHTNAFGEIANDGEKWVTYYQGSKKIDPEIQGNDLDVTNITVWLFNRPKEYTATLHTIDPNNVTTAIYNSEKDILIGSDEIEFKAFYNQRIGNATDSESSESDAETLNKYLGAYKISDTDVVKGKNLNTKEIVDYVDMPQTVTRNDDANSEPYSFQYWSYDPDGQFVASTSINYAYRVTNDITLYAVYGKTGLQFPGLTSFKNGIDFYYNGSGVGQVRLNTMMNPYNCPDNDETITEAAIMYVMLHGSDEYKGKSQDELLKLLLQDSGNGYGMTNLDVLREDIRRILLKEMTRAVATQKTGKVTVIDVEITASGFKYYVENADGTDSSALNLTTKNRLQFTTEFTRDKLKGKHMLAFTAMKRNNSWIVSDNYVDYNFVNGYNFE